MRSRNRFVIVVGPLLALAWMGGCSSDDSVDSDRSDQNRNDDTVATVENDDSVAGATVCATASGEGPTVVIDVDDESDGFGRFGLQTPASLAAGSVVLELNAVEDNGGPVSVSVASAGVPVFEFVQVAPGVRCAAELDLAAGDYTVTFGDSVKTFTVHPAG